MLWPSGLTETTYRDFKILVGMDANQRGTSKVAQMIWIVGTPVIFTFGVIGNIVTIIVLTKKQNRNTSTAIFLTTLAIADLMTILFLMPRWWIIYTFDFDIRYIHNIVCKVHWFFGYLFPTLSAMMLLIVTLERIISTTKPYRVRVWCNKKSALRISFFATLFIVCIMSHTLYGFSLVIESVNGHVNDTVWRNASNNASTLLNEHQFIGAQTSAKYTCLWYHDKGYMFFYTKVFQWINDLIYNILPQTVFFFGGILIVRTLSRSKKLRGKSSSMSSNTSNKNHSKIRNHSTQVTITMLTVNVAFLICASPIRIFMSGQVYWIDPEKGMNDLQEILWAIFNMMFYANHALNFVLYFLSGMKFRSDVIELLRCHKRAAVDREISTNNIVSISTTENVDGNAQVCTSEFIDGLSNYID